MVYYNDLLAGIVEQECPLDQPLPDAARAARHNLDGESAIDELRLGGGLSPLVQVQKRDIDMWR